MDLGGAAEEWYIWIGLAIASFAIAGIALAIPTTPPPDVHAAANTIDDIAASEYNATGEYDHDADFYWVDGRRIAMKNSGGISRESLRFGVATPVQGYPKLKKLLYGTPPTEVFDSDQSDPRELKTLAQQARDSVDSDDPTWIKADEKLHVRTVVWGDVHVTLVEM